MICACGVEGLDFRAVLEDNVRVTPVGLRRLEGVYMSFCESMWMSAKECGDCGGFCIAIARCEKPLTHSLQCLIDGRIAVECYGKQILAQGGYLERFDATSTSVVGFHLVILRLW